MSNAKDLFDEDNEEYGLKQYPLTPDESLPAPVFVLKAGQQEALDWIVPFCLRKQGDWRKVLLEGFAGTGKTFTINRIIEAVRRINPRISFGMTAPTHKAVRQLHKLSELKDSLDFGTIHSFLGLKLKQVKDPTNWKKMIEIFAPDPETNGDRKIDGINVLILDEASMLPDELNEHIEDVVRTGRLVVIYMGDGLQIPPVAKKGEPAIKNADAIPFIPSQRQSRKIHHIVLSEIVRQGAGNPIIEYSAAIREQYKNQFIDYPIPTENDTDSGIVKVPRSLPELRKLFEQYFCSEAFERDTDHMKIIAWRNDTTDYFNKEVRLLINKAESLPNIINGDRLVLNKPYFIGKTMLPNNEELDVIEHEVKTMNLGYHIIDHSKAFTSSTSDEVEPGKKMFEKELKIYSTKCRAMDGRYYPVIILHEDSKADFAKIQEEIKASAFKAEGYEKADMWRQFYKNDKRFADHTYNYCLTAHKSQGSTYEYAISMEWDIEQNRNFEERNRIRYVAATRARNKLFIVK